MCTQFYFLFFLGACCRSRVFRTIDPRWPDTLKIVPMQVLRVICHLSLATCLCRDWHRMRASISLPQLWLRITRFCRAISSGCSTSASSIEPIQNSQCLDSIFWSPKLDTWSHLLHLSIFYRCLWLSVWDKSLTGAEVSLRLDFHHHQQSTASEAAAAASFNSFRFYWGKESCPFSKPAVPLRWLWCYLQRVTWRTVVRRLWSLTCDIWFEMLRHTSHYAWHVLCNL